MPYCVLQVWQSAGCSLAGWPEYRAPPIVTGFCLGSVIEVVRCAMRNELN
jgi:hypothetical protein